MAQKIVVPRWAALALAVLVALACGLQPAAADVFTNVPEARGYDLVYELPVPNAAGFNSGAIPYSVDNRTSVGPFDRIAYYLELDDGSGLRYAYASMDAFTADPGKIGVPSRGPNGAFTTADGKWQQPVANMNVVSNVPGVVTGTGIATGNLEFWSTNYSATPSGTVPGGANVYDFDDTKSPGADYGSMQVHNYGAGQTIMAYNRWGSANGELGLGNQPSGHPDWTFTNNASTYSVKNLQVLVHPTPHVFTDVPEAADYTLVYSLDNIPDTLTNFHAGGVPYTVDRTAAVTKPFDRVAYYLELEGPTGGRRFAYASMDAFTTDVTKVGVPNSTSGAFFQQTVSNMNVVSNVPGIAAGTGLAGGNIEFWPNNYGRAGTLGLPGADDGKYDFDDSPANPVAGYGSMQIHNHGAGQTVLAYNAWGSGSRAGDLGIGNSPAANEPDWTFQDNVGSYTVRNLHVLVRQQGIELAAPTGRAVFQRDEHNRADVLVEGTYSGDVSRVEARAVPVPGFSGTPTPWQVIDAAPTGGIFNGALSLEGGWYQLEVRGFSGATPLNLESVDRVGVGEVFITAGQSNSANSGDCCTYPSDDRISAWTGSGWQHADDPQPIATGGGGSPWPSLGDFLVDEVDVPVGFASVGWGGTRVAQWLPGAAGPDPNGPLYDRLKSALDYFGPEGFRAVLWHQGESDAGSGTSTADYASRLQTVIDQSRLDAGWDVPWGVALVSYRPGAGVDQDIIDGQLQVINSDPLVFLGAMTDDMIVPYRNGSGYSGIHFNLLGLEEHGRRWLDPVLGQIQTVPEPASLGLLLLGCLLAAPVLGRRIRRRF